MPSTRLLGRKWGFGSDDLTVFAAIEISRRVVLILAPAAWLIFYVGCPCGALLTTWLSVNSALIIVEVLLLRASLLGTPFDERPRIRAGVGALAWAHAALYGADVVLVAAAAGLEVAGSDVAVCDAARAGWGRAAVWLVIVAQLACYLTALFWVCVCNAGTEGTSRWTPRQYKDCWRGICGRLLSETNDEGRADAIFSTLGRMCAAYFVDSQIELVPSDVATGMLLLRAAQRRRGARGGAAAAPPPADDAGLAAADEHESVVAALDEADHYFPYALAVYGWMLYSYTHTPCDTCSTCCSPGTLSSDWVSGVVEHDSQLGLNEKAIANTIREQRSGAVLLYATFEDERCERIPYAIFADRGRRRVVVALRGTLSLDDAITDLAAADAREATGADDDDPETPLLENHSISWEGETYGFPGAGEEAHPAMAGVARNTVDHLQSHALLDALLGGGGARPSPRVSSNPARARARDAALRALRAGDPAAALPLPKAWDLVVVGHSLGAGVASLVALFLRGRFRGVRCVAYSNPCGILSRGLAEHCDPFVTSVTVGDDVITRLSLATMFRIRDQIIRLLLSARASKSAIAWSGGDAGGCGDPDDDDAVLRPRGGDDIPGGALAHWSERRERQVELTERDGEVGRMFTPGRVLNIQEVKVATCCGTGCCGATSFSCAHGLVFGCRAAWVPCLSPPQYAASWARRDDLQEIIVSPTLVDDHMPNKVHAAIGSALQNARDGSAPLPAGEYGACRASGADILRPHSPTVWH